jgi:hypothetical protein
MLMEKKELVKGNTPTDEEQTDNLIKKEVLNKNSPLKIKPNMLEMQQ